MKKAILIIGNNDDQKQALADKLAVAYEWANVEKIPAYSESPFLFCECKQNTKLIIIQEVRTIQELIYWRNVIQDGINVHAFGRDSFFLCPEFILISSIPLTSIIEGFPKFSYRYNLIECHGEKMKPAYKVEKVHISYVDDRVITYVAVRFSNTGKWRAYMINENEYTMRKSKDYERVVKNGVCLEKTTSLFVFPDLKGIECDAN
ncbi:MAG: hypothetical protein ACK40G_13770 [Cytophagaceae bacterium]